MEPVQDIVRVLLEHEGYVVRCNTRYKVPYGYSNIDILAIKIDPATGAVQDRICGEVKAHLDLSLTPGTLRGFTREYATLLDLTKFDLMKAERARFKAKRDARDDRATEILGPSYRRVLFHAGPKPADGGAGARDLLRQGVEVRWVQGMLGEHLDKLGHLEGDEPLVRLLNAMKAWKVLISPRPGAP